MKRFLLPLLLSACGFVANPVLADPFGFDVSSRTSPDETYDYCKKLLDFPYWFACDTAPEPHVDLEKYYILYTEDFGVCEIRAYGKYLVALSDELKKATNEVSDYVKLNYGDWSERIYKYPGYYWLFSGTRSGVNRIQVMGGSRDRSSGRVIAIFNIPCTGMISSP